MTKTSVNESMTLAFRVSSLVKLDFYRLFHTPLLYIMLAVSALIPALIMSMSGMDGTGKAAQATTVIYTNAWQLIESTGGSAVGANPFDFGGYANINMVYIFAGLLMAIFVAHDYSSGFVKNIFTVHAKKVDYVISKSIIGIFSGAGMIIAYCIGTVAAGILMGKSFDVNVAGLIMCLVSKVFLMGLFCSLFLSVSVFFRSNLWLTIIFTFLIGMLFYPVASIATLGANLFIVFASLIGSIAGAVLIGSVSRFILGHRDLA